MAEEKNRIISIDALRGFDMFWIIGGGAMFKSLHEIFQHPATQWLHTQLNHVAWEGFWFEDLIMPLFMFLAGVVMPFSFERRLAEGDKLKLYRHILLRVVILWILGMIAQGNLLAYDLSMLKLYSNTLQAIAAGYLIASVVIIHFRLRIQYILFAAFLLLYWALLTLVPVPGFGAGQLTEDGNLAIFIDKTLLGQFQDGTPYSWILSSMTFAATVLMGVFSGRFLRLGISGSYKACGLMAAGLVYLIAGWVWGGWFPIIKHIWTSSFVLFSGGICMILLGLFYVVIDVWGWKKWAFGFVVIGSNAIVAYMAGYFIYFGNIGDYFIGGLGKWTEQWMGFVHSTTAFVLLWLVLWYLYRNKYFVKI
jgi:predicted acyltransferase